MAIDIKITANCPVGREVPVLIANMNTEVVVDRFVLRPGEVHSQVLHEGQTVFAFERRAGKYTQKGVTVDVGSSGQGRFNFLRQAMPKPITEEAVEERSRAMGLDAPRLTPALVDACIVGEAYYVFPGTTTTICCLILRNGFTVIGESSAASATNFNEELGQQIARGKARERIWALEGYLLKQKLFEARLEASTQSGG